MGSERVVTRADPAVAAPVDATLPPVAVRAPAMPSLTAALLADPEALEALSTTAGNGAIARLAEPATVGATITAADPSPHVAWGALWGEEIDQLNLVRMPLEVLRAYPGYGILFGGAADVISVYQDFDQISEETAPFLKGTMAARSLLMVLNNALGHVLYVNQLVTDGLLVSMVGAEFAPLSMDVHSLLSFFKVTLDVATVLVDFGLTCGAAYRAAVAPPGSASQEAFAAMFGNYTANTLGGVVTAVIDTIDFLTGGLSNGEVLRTGVTAVSGILKGAVKLRPIMRDVLLGWAGIWGGGWLTPSSEQIPTLPQLTVPDARTLGRQAAGTIIAAELREMKQAYETGDALLGRAATTTSEMFAQLREAMTAHQGVDPLIAAREGARGALDDLAARMSEFAEIGAAATTAQDYADQVIAAADAALASIDALQVPQVSVPGVELGDGGLAEAAETVVNTFGAVAGDALRGLVGQVRTAVEQLRPQLREPVAGLREQAQEIDLFASIVATQAQQMVAWGSETAAAVSARLARCETIEDFVDFMINEVTTMLGIETTLTVDDVRAGWSELGVELDAAIAWADELASTPDDEDARSDETGAATR